MTNSEKTKVLKTREYSVVKSNDLVLKTRYDFSANEQKTIAYICSMIKPIKPDKNSVPFILEYEFNILNYIRVLGLEENGKLYTEIKSILKSLSDKSMWYRQEDNSETIVRWLDKVTINEQTGLIKIKIDDKLVPLLFALKNKYLSYGLKNVLCMKSQYSIRLYELLKAHYNLKIAQTDHRSSKEKNQDPKSISWTIDLDELKKQLMVDKVQSYKDYGRFRNKILEISQKEINQISDMTIYFSPVTKGRKTIKVKFTIIKKNTTNQCLINLENDKKLKKS